MNRKEIIIGAMSLALVAVVILWWLEQQDKEKWKQVAKEKDQAAKDQEDYSRQLEINNLRLIQELLKADLALPDIVKKQLLDLITRYEIRNAQIAIEISSVVKLIEVGEFEKGVMAIAKIIENILKEKLQKREELMKTLTKPNGKKKRAVFADYIECAKQVGIFDKAEAHFALGIKEYRNEEAHVVGVKRQLNYNMSSILTGIELILKCDSFSFSAN
ncbi:hypothetical protein CAP35_12400 [Chitinophagaceae bacterium IBVUCB1]|nr:hypothetical protein CAP35_12400 [Chitinophagaceae bacterium IBVUCB1]